MPDDKESYKRTETCESILYFRNMPAGRHRLLIKFVGMIMFVAPSLFVGALATFTHSCKYEARCLHLGVAVG